MFWEKNLGFYTFNLLCKITILQCVKYSYIFHFGNNTVNSTFNYLFPFKYPLIVDTLNWNLFSDKDGWMVSLVRRLRKMPDRVTSGRFVHCTLYYCMTLRCPACSCSEMLWKFSWIIESDDKDNLWSKLDFCLLVFSCFDKPVVESSPLIFISYRNKIWKWDVTSTQPLIMSIPILISSLDMSCMLHDVSCRLSLQTAESQSGDPPLCCRQTSDCRIDDRRWCIARVGWVCYADIANFCK